MAPIVAMIIGLFPVPYGYFTFLKIIVCPILIYYAVKLTDVKNISPVLRWTFIVLVFIYNPILQFHLYSKFPWIVINFITSMLLIIVGADRKFEKRMKVFDDIVLDRKKKEMISDRYIKEKIFDRLYTKWKNYLYTSFYFC